MPEKPIGDEARLLRAMVEHRSLMFFDRLIAAGYVWKWPSGYEITQKGRAALKDQLGTGNDHFDEWGLTPERVRRRALDAEEALRQAESTQAIDRAFYDLVVAERNYERAKCDRLERELAATREGK